MKIIVCLDDNGGMMFNNRRQSRDRVLIDDVLNMTKGQKLFISAYSKLLFEGRDADVRVSEDISSETGGEDFCFLEDIAPSKLGADIDGIVIYRWNREYPRDMTFDIDLNGFRLVKTYDFEGYSHEKITKEIYVK